MRLCHGRFGQRVGLQPMNKEWCDEKIKNKKIIFKKSKSKTINKIMPKCTARIRLYYIQAIIKVKVQGF